MTTWSAPTTEAVVVTTDKAARKAAEKAQREAAKVARYAEKSKRIAEKVERRNAQVLAKQEAKAQRDAETKELIGSFRFFKDGTVQKEVFGKVTKPRSVVLGSEYDDGTNRKNGWGRAGGAILTGGVSLLGSANKGNITRILITEDWTDTWSNKSDMMKLEAKAHAAAQQAILLAARSDNG